MDVEQSPARTPNKKPKLAVWKFASCDGCQLSLLDCEDELLMVPELVDIAHFPEATRAKLEGPYDVSLVEGSICAPEHFELIEQIRRQSKFLVAIGACATSGGIQALKNYRDHRQFISAVYARPEYIQTLETSTPISDHVKVDFELRGCPINKQQLLSLLVALANGSLPDLPQHSVCVECKASGVPCVLVTGQSVCLGPVTHAGCGALCPRYRRGCFGCYGPSHTPNPESMVRVLLDAGASPEEIERLASTFNVNTAGFQEMVKTTQLVQLRRADQSKYKPQG